MRVLRGRRPSTTLLTTGGVLTLASLVLGYLVGAAVKSPAQALAETAAPPLTVLTEPVVRGDVGRSVTFDGTVQRRHLTPVVAPPATREGGASVVTRIPVRDGDRVVGGDLVVEVSGRPVIALSGNLPAYRSLMPGDLGPDVAQLQRALARAGLPASDARGQYGPATAAAVAALYRRHGYEATVVGIEEVRAAEDSVRSAERVLGASGGRKAGAAATQYAREDLDQARAELANAQARSGAQATLGEVVFLPQLPARVAEVRTGSGRVAEGTLLTLASGRLVVRGSPVSADGDQIRRRDRARLLMTPSGETSGVVTGSTSIQAGVTGGGEQDVVTAGPSARTYTIVPAQPLPAGAAGTPVRVIVAVETSRRPGLTVPIAAVSVSADGRDTVTVVRSARHDVVEVVPGFAGDGLVHVTPVEPGALVDGDLVVVGTGGTSGS